ncbi:hypothetical protein GR257_36650 [Rhizobium leguminosarum]|uniref:Uncharacterized protein n=1 Tax=Rhizobium leguminosarum TaxID=384 RepID=A0A7K3VSY8_RHILE|nr:hypothetical protein [Rhizobium leguminosarum]
MSSRESDLPCPSQTPNPILKSMPLTAPQLEGYSLISFVWIAGYGLTS